MSQDWVLSGGLGVQEKGGIQRAEWFPARLCPLGGEGAQGISKGSTQARESARG